MLSPWSRLSAAEPSAPALVVPGVDGAADTRASVLVVDAVQADSARTTATAAASAAPGRRWQCAGSWRPQGTPTMLGAGVLWLTATFPSCGRRRRLGSQDAPSDRLCPPSAAAFGAWSGWPVEWPFGRRRPLGGGLVRGADSQGSIAELQDGTSHPPVSSSPQTGPSQRNWLGQEVGNQDSTGRPCFQSTITGERSRAKCPVGPADVGYLWVGNAHGNC